MQKWYLVAVLALVLTATSFLLSAPSPPESRDQSWKLPLTKGERYEFTFGLARTVGEVVEYPTGDWVRIAYQVRAFDGRQFNQETKEEWVNLRSVNTVRPLTSELWDFPVATVLGR